MVMYAQDKMSCLTFKIFIKLSIDNCFQIYYIKILRDIAYVNLLSTLAIRQNIFEFISLFFS